MDSHPDDPMSVIDVDTQQVSHGIHRARWVSVTATFLALIAVVSFLAVTVINQRHAIESSCDFWRLLGTVNPAPTKANPHPPTPALITLLVDSRNSYIGQGCSPALPPPSPVLLHYAAVYHIPVNK